MGQKVKLSSGITIEIKDIPFARGGEGEVFEIIAPIHYAGQVLKIYSEEKRDKQKEDKLKFLIANRPELSSADGHHSVIWPIHLAYISNAFVGFTMPKASGIKLELLCHPKLPKNLPEEWRKFDFNSPKAIDKRLKVCFNISAALSQIHSFGTYVLVDMKPENIMINPNGRISVIDIDSIEVFKNNLLLFPAQVATPEYTPPEFYTSIKDIQKSVIDETWDRFSVAVIFYRLLFGIHPFTASLKNPYENLTNINEIIQKGFLPVGRSASVFKTIPPPHQKFYKLDKNIQSLFLNGLDEGNNNPKLRPTADDWCRLLSPDPGIKINRQLPSRKIKCFIPIYSESVVLKSSPIFNIVKPNYLKKSIDKSLWSRFLSFFAKSKKDIFYEKIGAIQNIIDRDHASILSIYNQFSVERNKFKQQEYAILSDEKETIDRLVLDFQQKARQIDDKAQNYFLKEMDAYASFEKEYIHKLNGFEFKIKEEYEKALGLFEREYTQERDSLQLKLYELANRETEKIKALDVKLKNVLDGIKRKIQKLELDFRNKIDEESKKKLDEVESRRAALKIREDKLITEALEKYQSKFSNHNLSQYRIADEKHMIFTDSYASPDLIVANLARNGIITAADIKGVDASGRILKSNGSWVKVSEVAMSRARKLDDWRRKKERLGPVASAPQSLPYSEEFKVKSDLLAEFQNLDDEERKIKSQILISKSSIPRLLEIPLNQARETESRIIKEIQDQKYLISRNSRKEQDEVSLKLNGLRKSYNKLKQSKEQAYLNRTKQYKEEIDKLNLDKDKYFKEKKKYFDSINDNLSNDLTILNFRFTKSNADINLETKELLNHVLAAFNDSYVAIANKMKESISTYNESVSKLLSIQNEYKIHT